MFHFAAPYFLILLVLVPLTAWHRRRMPASALAFSRAGGEGEPGPSIMLQLGRALPLLYYLVLVLVVAALARPQWGTRQMILDTKGVNIILAIDLSESMGAVDFQQGGRMINRLAAVKQVVRDFIGKRSGDRIGMVVFGSQAYTQLPLNRDYNTIAAILDRLEIGAAGRSTAVGDAIGIALKRLEDVESRANVIILLTDGRSNSGELEPLAAAGIAAGKKVRIYTVGVGGRGRAPFLVNDPIFGQRTIYQRVDLDEETLGAIAERTGGLYFKATDLEGLEKIYNTIDQMEKTDVKIKVYDQFNDLYLWCLLPALGLLGIWIVLKNTRFLSIP
jgi:Ca-activated chloride channel family protein